MAVGSSHVIVRRDSTNWLGPSEVFVVSFAPDTHRASFEASLIMAMTLGALLAAVWSSAAEWSRGPGP